MSESAFSELNSISDAFVLAFPKGCLYPLDLEDFDKNFEEILKKELKMKIIKEIKTSMHKSGERIFIDLPLPKRFTRDIVLHKWVSLLDAIFEKVEAEIEEKSDSYFTNFIETITTKRVIEQKINEKTYKNLDREIIKYENLLQNSFTHMKDLLQDMKIAYSYIYLESELPVEYIMVVNKALNATINYVDYLKSEFSIINSLKRFKAGRSKAKSTKPLFVLFDNLNKLEYKMMNQLQKLQLFMDIWHAEDVDDLFSGKTKLVYSEERFREESEYFINLIEKLNYQASEFHRRIILTARNRKKKIPMTFTADNKESDNDKIKLFANLIHST